jgi:alkylation response protein AidB-like acyl-CoA dehydrogenase
MDEEHKVLESVLREFSQKEIDPVNKKIELEGLSSDLKSKLASQGFLGALAPVETGGASLDRLSYTILLREIAAASPSAAFYIFIQNSLVIKSLMKNNDIETISSISSGKISGTLAYSQKLNMLESGHITFNEKIEGILNGVLNSKADFIIVNNDTENKLYIVRSGFEKMPDHEQLGFRGVSFSPVRFYSTDFKALSTTIDEILEDIHLPVAAMAIGIASGALSKAMTYAKERDAFMHKLKDFQPLAFGMAQAYSELDALNTYLMEVAQGEKDLKKELMVKLISLDFARRTSKLALQVHGGYGYLMDFGIEKFYRDAMFLSIVGGHSLNDKVKLSELIFETKAGWI